MSLVRDVDFLELIGIICDAGATPQAPTCSQGLWILSTPRCLQIPEWMDAVDLPLDLYLGWPDHDHDLGLF